MQLDTITELLEITDFKVSHLVHYSEERIEVVLKRTEYSPCVCSGCGRVHNSGVHSVNTIKVEDLSTLWTS